MMLRRLRWGFWSAGLRLLPILFTFLRPQSRRNVEVVQQGSEIAVLHLAGSAVRVPVSTALGSGQQDGRRTRAVSGRMDARILEWIRGVRMRAQHPEQLRHQGVGRG